MDEDLIVRRNPRVVFRDLASGQGAVLLDPETTAYHSLNDVGALIWRLLEEPLTFGELVSRLRATFEDVTPALRDDVSAYVSELASRDLVQLGRSASAP